jgi:putative transposase
MSLDPRRDKRLFLKVVKDAKQRYAFSIENFCIMGNHFHFIIQPLKDENLSKIMQWILGMFARRYNKAHRLTGHLWGERFFSRIIEGLRDFMEVFKYINDNPVKANQVSYSWEWEYGGIYHIRNNLSDILSLPSPYVEFLFPRFRRLELC